MAPPTAAGELDEATLRRMLAEATRLKATLRRKHTENECALRAAESGRLGRCVRTKQGVLVAAGESPRGAKRGASKKLVASHAPPAAAPPPAVTHGVGSPVWAETIPQQSLHVQPAPRLQHALIRAGRTVVSPPPPGVLGSRQRPTPRSQSPQHRPVPRVPAAELEQAQARIAELENLLEVEREGHTIELQAARETGKALGIAEAERAAVTRRARRPVGTISPREYCSRLRSGQGASLGELGGLLGRVIAGCQPVHFAALRGLEGGEGVTSRFCGAVVLRNVLAARTCREVLTVMGVPDAIVTELARMGTAFELFIATTDTLGVYNAPTSGGDVSVVDRSRELLAENGWAAVSLGSIPPPPTPSAPASELTVAATPPATPKGDRGRSNLAPKSQRDMAAAHDLPPSEVASVDASSILPGDPGSSDLP
eukprot:Hpha_TRINITY_DN2704_c0_g1::TRINITY_DN2704_c0_g1_i1::g.110391::m.110391